VWAGNWKSRLRMQLWTWQGEKNHYIHFLWPIKHFPGGRLKGQTLNRSNKLNLQCPAKNKKWPNMDYPNQAWTSSTWIGTWS
jgi:hypothetical protein